MNEFFHHYTEILTDPAHLAVEVTLMLVVDVLFMGMIWPLLRAYMDRRLHQQHQILDAEHGISHHGDHVHHDDHVHAPAAGGPQPAVDCDQN